MQSVFKATLGAIAAAGVSIAAAQAGTVSYFFDSTFVDTDNEAINQRDDLVGSGNTVVSFSGTDDAAWVAALSGVDALVIPELERDDISTAISASTKNEIMNFVSNGGNLVVTNGFSGDSITLLNEIFGFSITTNDFGPTTFLDAGEAAGTDFAAGPAFLDDLDAVNGVASSSLDAGIKDIYNDGFDFTAVFTAAFGAGNITFLGYDWFAGQDAGWASVQDIAVNLGVTGDPVPLPLAMPLFLVGLGGLGAIARKRKA